MKDSSEAMLESVLWSVEASSVKSGICEDCHVSHVKAFDHGSTYCLETFSEESRSPSSP